MECFTTEQVKYLHSLSVEDCIRYWHQLEELGRKKGKLEQVVRILVQADLYYLLVQVCKRVDMLPCVNKKGFIDNQFIFDRCREFEANPDGHLDLWAREFYKSTVITYGYTIQSILKNPEITIGIFSHTRPIAKAFLLQIMRELESNKILHAAFPDVLWGERVNLAPKWNEDDGIIVKRNSNPKESTVEAWGLVDGQPISKHYQILIYDDIVVKDSVSTPEMIEKTKTALENSYNLGVTPGGIRRFIGTRWHFNDAYKMIIDRKTAKLRVYPGTHDGTEEGEPIFWNEEVLRLKRQDMGPYTFAANVLLNPKADAMQGFKREWLRHYDSIQKGKLNWYLVCDSASSKKRGSDFTAMWAVGLGVDKNYYCIPEVRDRLNLKERGDRLFKLHRDYKPKQVRYEKYGLMSDTEHYQSRMEHENYRFNITEVGGQTSKSDRIKRLLPLFEAGRIWMPKSKFVTDWQRVPVDLVQAFIEEEYMAFPVGLHEDLLDALARICEPDLSLIWPMEEKPKTEPKPFIGNSELRWMA